LNKPIRHPPPQALQIVASVRSTGLHAFCHTKAMQPPGPRARRQSFRRIGSVLAVALLALPQLLVAQDPVQDPEPPLDPNLYTLHVYANLIQVPTLVLSTDRKPIPLVPLDKFQISLDSGPTFRPTKMKIAGNDPISLSILLDASGDQDKLLKNFAESLASLVPESLHPADHVTIYAVDCALVRTSNDVPANATLLRSGVASALAAPNLHGPKGKPACAYSLRLWDAVYGITRALGELPGRRALLVVSSGNDTKSSLQFADVRQFADSRSVAIFGLRDRDRLEATRTLSRTLGHNIYSNIGADSHDYLFTQLCESNGGLVSDVYSQDLTKSLQDFVAMLRGRYIIEFPRGDNAPAGNHIITISIEKQNAFIASSGVVVPLDDIQSHNNPCAIPSGPSPATFGTRRPPEPAKPKKSKTKVTPPQDSSPAPEPSPPAAAPDAPAPGAYPEGSTAAPDQPSQSTADPASAPPCPGIAVPGQSEPPPQTVPPETPATRPATSPADPSPASHSGPASGETSSPA